MMRKFSRALAFVCLLLVNGSLAAQDKPATIDPSGTWRWEYELGGQTWLDSIQLKMDDNKKVVGSYKGRAEKTH